MDSLLQIIIIEFAIGIALMLIEPTIKSQRQRFLSWLGERLPVWSVRIVEQIVQRSVNFAGLLCLLIVGIIQWVGVVQATSSYATARFPLAALVLTMIIWEILVFGGYKASMKLVRFRFKIRRKIFHDISLTALRLTILRLGRNIGL